MPDSVISVENLGKSYLVGHKNVETERYTALRDVVGRNARNLTRKVADMARGRQIIQGDEVEEFWALRDLNFEIETGQVVGIVGRNGAGKSTLLKVLSRITEPSRGRVTLRGRVASLLEVGTGFHPELSGRENIFLNGAILGMQRSEILRKFDQIVDFAGVEKFLDTPVKRYSSGMYVRLAFAVAAHLEPEILVVDEVLAVGDSEFQKKCLGKMRDVAKGGRTVLFVSHNMAAVNQLCDRAILLTKGQMMMDASASEVTSKYLTLGEATTSVVLKSDPKKEFNFTGMRCKNQSGELQGNFGFDESVEIEFCYDFAQFCSGMEVAMRVSRMDGVAVFTTTNSEIVASTKGAGSYTCTVSVPSHFLAPGSYSVTLCCHIPNQSVIDDQPDALEFSVVETGSELSQYAGRNYGIVHCKCDWTSREE